MQRWLLSFALVLWLAVFIGKSKAEQCSCGQAVHTKDTELDLTFLEPADAFSSEVNLYLSGDRQTRLGAYFMDLIKETFPKTTFRWMRVNNGEEKDLSCLEGPYSFNQFVSKPLPEKETVAGMLLGAALLPQLFKSTGVWKTPSKDREHTVLRVVLILAEWYFAGEWIPQKDIAIPFRLLQKNTCASDAPTHEQLAALAAQHGVRFLLATHDSGVRHSWVEHLDAADVTYLKTPSWNGQSAELKKARTDLATFVKSRLIAFTCTGELHAAAGANAERTPTSSKASADESLKASMGESSQEPQYTMATRSRPSRLVPTLRKGLVTRRSTLN